MDRKNIIEQCGQDNQFYLEPFFLFRSNEQLFSRSALNTVAIISEKR